MKNFQMAISDLSAALSFSYGRSDLLRLRAFAYGKQGNHVAEKKDMQDAEKLDALFQPPSSLGGQNYGHNSGLVKTFTLLHLLIAPGFESMRKTIWLDFLFGSGEPLTRL